MITYLLARSHRAMSIFPLASAVETNPIGYIYLVQCSHFNLALGDVDGFAQDERGCDGDEGTEVLHVQIRPHCLVHRS